MASTDITTVLPKCEGRDRGQTPAVDLYTLLRPVLIMMRHTSIILRCTRRIRAQNTAARLPQALIDLGHRVCSSRAAVFRAHHPRPHISLLALPSSRLVNSTRS